MVDVMMSFILLGIQPEKKSGLPGAPFFVPSVVFFIGSLGPDHTPCAAVVRKPGDFLCRCSLNGGGAG